MYFTADMMDEAKAHFLQIANDSRCPELIRICSFNMAGQISRLVGKNKEALESFNQVARLLEKRLSFKGEHASNLALAKLHCSALFSRAEIYNLQRDYTASISEYNRLLSVLIQYQIDNIMSQYIPLVDDRISQIHLQKGEIREYVILGEKLTRVHGKYYRTPIIKFELECIKFLEEFSPNLQFVNGSSDAPTHVFAYLKCAKDKTVAQHIVYKLNNLCKETQDTYSGIVLRYHYAWFLDTLGEKNKAAETLAQIFSVNIANTNNRAWGKAVVETVQEYAKIQYAIIAGERANYTEALRVLNMRAYTDQSHISELAKSVSKSIEILKREVPKNETEPK